MANTLFVELKDGRGGNLNANNTARFYRTYQTGYDTLSACLNDPLCPNLGDKHPEVPSDIMVCTGYDFQMNPDGTYRLTCLYSSDPLHIPRWSFGSTKVKVQLPIFYLQEKRLNNLRNTVVKSWVPAPEFYSTIEETRVTLQATVHVKKLDYTQNNIIIKEYRKLHTINGVDYLFLSPSVNPIDRLYDSITYIWMHDEGTYRWANNTDGTIQTPWLNPFNPQTNPIFFPPVIQGGDGPDGPRVRLPYTYLIPIPPPTSNDGTVPATPQIVWLPIGRRNPAGWRDLPGLLNNPGPR